MTPQKDEITPEFYHNPTNGPRIKSTKGGAISSQILRVFAYLNSTADDKIVADQKIAHKLKKQYEFIGKIRQPGDADFSLLICGVSPLGQFQLYTNAISCEIDANYIYIPGIQKGAEYKIAFYEFTVR